MPSKGLHGDRKKRKKNDPPRPKQSIAFTLPQESSLAQATSTGEESSVARLNAISILLTAVHRRNKNQHRNQLFYRHLLVLRRHVKKLINICEGEIKLRHPASTPKTSQIAHTPTAADIRRRFEQEARLRSQRDIVEDYIRETVLPAAYVAFSGLVADTQFANLGLVLMGVLADVVGVVGSMRRVEINNRDKNVSNRVQGTGRTVKGGRLMALSTVMTGPDHGVMIERVYDSDGASGANEELSGRDMASKEAVLDEEIDMGEVISREAATTTSTAAPTLHENADSAKISEPPERLSHQAPGTNSRAVSPDSLLATPVKSDSGASSSVKDELIPHTHNTYQMDSTSGRVNANPTKSDEKNAADRPRPSTRVSTPASNSDSVLSTPLQHDKVPSPPSHSNFIPKSTPQRSNDPLQFSPHPPPPAHRPLASTISTLTAQIRSIETSTQQERPYRPGQTTSERQQEKDKSDQKTSKSKSSKRKKKTNAIDDLFSGFG